MIIPSKFSGYRRDGVRLYYKKDGGSAPPPDPRLVEAQIRSMGVQDSVIQQIMQNSTSMLPLQQAQLQFGLDSAKNAYEQSQEDRDWMLGRRSMLSGVQDKIVGQANDFNEENRGAELAAKSQADVERQFAASQAQADRDMYRRGVNPNSGKAASMASMQGIERAKAMVGASSAARTAAHAEGLSLMDRANNTLAGYPSMGMQATGQGAGFGGLGVNYANSTLAGINSGFNAAGSMAGQMGQNATSMYGQQSNFNLGSARLEQSGDNAMWGTLGQAAGMMMMRSDERIKRRVRGLRPSEALDVVDAMPIKEWEYKPGAVQGDDGRRHIGPMAQDVEAAAGGDVAPGGQMVDVASLTGLNIAATQDLNRKVDQLADVVKRLAIGGLKREKSNA